MTLRCCVLLPLYRNALEWTSPPLRWTYFTDSADRKSRADGLLRAKYTHGGAPFPVYILWNSHPPVKAGVLLLALIQSREIQVSHIPEKPPGQKVVLHETDQALHLSLCKRMPRFAEFRLEPHGPHELHIVLLPRGLPILPPTDDYAFHVVRQDVLRDAHVAETMDYTNEQVLLLGVGEELHISLPAEVAHYSKASTRIFLSGIGLDLRKAPIHVECFGRGSGVPPPPVSLWSNHMAGWRDKVLVGQNVVLEGSLSTSVPVCMESAETHSRVCHTVLQRTIQNTRVAAQKRCGSWPSAVPSCGAVWHRKSRGGVLTLQG